jgi:hypothetical protein
MPGVCNCAASFIRNSDLASSALSHTLRSEIFCSVLCSWEEKNNLWLIIGLCILLRVYQSNIGRPPYATQYFSARFYCALISLHVSVFQYLIEFVIIPKVARTCPEDTYINWLIWYWLHTAQSLIIQGIFRLLWNILYSCMCSTASVVRVPGYIT